MHFLRVLWFRLRALFQRVEINLEFDDEFRFHIERETEANIKRGMNPDEARRTALAEFGGVERFKEDLRDERGVRWLDDVAGDVKHGFRLLRKNKLFSGAVIGTLALGIGATSTIFAVVNGVLLRKPAYYQPDRVVSISQSRKGQDIARASTKNYAAWVTEQHTLSSLALAGPSSGTLTGFGEPKILVGHEVTASYFIVFEARAVIGRVFQAADELTGAERAIILSHALWTGTFGADSSIVGRIISIGDVPNRVVGIMPSNFDAALNAQFWTSMRLGELPANTEAYFNVVARMRDNVTLAAVQSDLDAIVKHHDEAGPGPSRGDHAIVMSEHDRQFGNVRKPLALLLGAVVMLLLIACVNVANLTLARSADRRREFTVRLALGASRWRLIRQLFIENSLLAVLGGGIGALVPLALVRTFVAMSGDSLAGVSDIHVDANAILFTGLITVAAAMMFGLAPAVSGTRADPALSLAVGNARSSAGKSQSFTRAALVAIEIAVALTLLNGAGLLAASLSHTFAIKPNFTPDGMFAAFVQLPSARYKGDLVEQAFYDAFESRVGHIPGVQSAAQTNGIPMHGFSYGRDVKHVPDDGKSVNVMFTHVSATFARTVGMRLVSGRFIDSTDRKGSPPVVMISSTLARAMFPGQDPIGRYFDGLLATSKPSPIIIGVVDDVPLRNIEDEPLPVAFLPSSQNDGVTQWIVVRSSLPETVIRAAVAAAARGVDARLPVNKFLNMRTVLDNAYAPRRLGSTIVGTFAGFALLLAIIGLYGLMAHAVAVRTRELGIRIALGATGDNVVRLVLRHGMLLTTIGITCGIAMSFALARTLSGLLYDVTTHDPFVFAAAPVSLAVIALLACYIPARRATRVNPMIALRQE